MNDDRTTRGTAVDGKLMAIDPAEVQDAMAQRVGATVTALVADGIGGHRLASHVDVAHDDGVDLDANNSVMSLLAHHLGDPRSS